MDITLEYNRSIISAQNVELNGSFNCGAGCFFFHNIMDGAVRVIIIDTNMLNIENTAIVDIVFKALRAGSTELKLRAELAKPSNGKFITIKSDVINGFVNVKPMSAQATETTTQIPLTQTPPTEKTPTKSGTYEIPAYDESARVITPTTLVERPVQTGTIQPTVMLTQVIKEESKEKEEKTPVQTTTAKTTILITVTKQQGYGKSYNKSSTNVSAYYDIIKSIPGMEILIAVIAIILVFVLRGRITL